MPFERLSIPNNSNHFYSAVSLGLLLPLIKDDALFDEATTLLFGSISARAGGELLTELESYKQTSFPASLTKLINTKLRARLAQYIESNQSNYLSFFESNESLSRGLKAIKEGEHFLGRIEIQALANLTHLCVRVHGPWFPEDGFKDFIPPSAAGSVVHLTTLNGHYQSLIDPNCLTDEQRKNVFPDIIIQTTERPEAVNSQIFKRSELKRILNKTLSEIPEQLALLAKEIPSRPVIEQADSFPTPTDLQGSVRFDAVRELHFVRAEMTRVKLSTAYDLCFLTSPDQPLDKNRIYVVMKEDHFDYVLLKPNNERVEDSILFSKLDYECKRLITLDQLSLCLPQIIEIISSRGHALVTQKPIGENLSLPAAAGIGVVSGAAAVGLIASIGEFGIGAGTGFAALGPVGIPAVILVLTTVGVHTFGNGFAVQYKKALEDVSTLLNQQRYKEAADRLDQELARHPIIKGARSFYLTNQHYALAHYFRAVCAEERHEYGEAYEQYQEASIKAVKESTDSLTFFVTQLQLIKLLQKSPAVYLPRGINRTNEINRILISLTQNAHYHAGFVGTYWQMHDYISHNAQQFLEPRPLSASEIHSVNASLQENRAFILKHFAKGSGSFMHVFNTFFQGCTLAYIDETNPSYLNYETKYTLLTEFGIKTQAKESTKKMAAKKLYQCAQLLHVFKQEHEELARNNEAIRSSIDFINDFIAHFQILSIEEPTATPELCNELAQALSVNEQQLGLSIARIDSSIDFMVGLKRDFSLSYETVSTWLDALLSEPGVADRICPSTGDTMLHKLVTLPYSQIHLTAKIQQAAKHLSHFSTVLNRNNETAQKALGEHDPFRLEQIIYGDAASAEAHDMDDLNLDERDEVKEYTSVIQYHQLSSQNAEGAINKALDTFLNSQVISASLLTHIGALLHNASAGMKRDYVRAKWCFEQAAKQNQPIALYNLGLMHERAHGMQKNKVTAARYYHLSEEHLYPDALVAYTNLLGAHDISSVELNKIACSYHHPSTEIKEGIKGDYDRARRIYERAAEKGSSNAYFNLGLIFLNAQGVNRNFVTAAQYFQLAKDKGDTTAHKRLTSILNSKDIKGTVLNKIAALYIHGTNGIAVNYQEAIRFFEKAGERGYPQAFRTIAAFYEQGTNNIGKNIVTAAEYYRKALEHGDNRIEIQIIHDKLMSAPARLLPSTQKKRLSKLFEQALITACSKESGGLNMRDSNKKTLLHRVAARKQFKHCARLFLFGANQEIVDADGHNPLYYLSPTEKEKVNLLQMKLVALTQNLSLDPWVVLARNVHVIGSSVDSSQVETALKNFCQITAIRPLMDLAHLAALGLHDLSNRAKFIMTDYDSDNDDVERINIEKQHLSIHYDARSDSVENMFHYGQTGRELVNARGVYTHQNAIYIGGACTAKERKGTMIHELTHFLAQEVFKNHCNPYAETDLKNKERFESIIPILKEKDRKYDLDPILARVFSGYAKERWVRELIVRVPQLIVENPDYTEEKLKETLSPELLAYYNEVFLPAIVQHTKTLKNRALSHWDEALFTQNAQSGFTPHLETKMTSPR